MENIERELAAIEARRGGDKCAAHADCYTSDIAALLALVREAGAVALEEAADEMDLPGSDATGYYASEQDSGYREAERHTEAYLRARAVTVRGGE